METLTEGQVKQIIQEINESAEETRRVKAKRRHDIYADGGRKFLIEAIKREFGEDSLREMRLAPLNILKKIINKKSAVYARPAIRMTESASDQALVDYYVDELGMNELMQKANRYYNLFSNTVLYAVPSGDEIKACVVPPYLYSVMPNQFDQTKLEGFIFNRFMEEDRLLQSDDLASATGVEGWDRQRGTENGKGLVGSEERDDSTSRQYIFWTDSQHFTTDDNGNRIIFYPELGEDQFINPIMKCPVVSINKDRDAEPWATQGEDMVDLTIAIQQGWSDLLTIAKNQGFSILTIISPDEPKKLVVGVNKAIWLKQNPGQETPSINYVTGNSPLSEYKELLMELLGLLLTTNDMAPGSVSGLTNAKNFSSGFQALIEMADTLEALEADKPILRNAEHEFWEVIAGWHNYMYDIGVLNEEAKALGKFSDDVDVMIHYSDMKPIESEQDRINAVEKLTQLDLLTKEDALKKLNPDLTAGQIEKKIKELAEGRAQRVADMNLALNTPDAKSMMEGDYSNGQSKESSEEETSKENEVTNSTDTRVGADGVDQNIQKLALNGAQVTALVDVVTKVAAGLLPRDSAIAIIAAAFQMDVTTAADILGNVGAGFKPTGNPLADPAKAAQQQPQEQVKPNGKDQG